jgi:hypothetical protein
MAVLIDSEDTLKFSALMGIRPRIESIGVAMANHMEARAQHERLRSSARHKLQGNSPRSNAQWENEDRAYNVNRYCTRDCRAEGRWYTAFATGPVAEQEVPE